MREKIKRRKNIGEQSFSSADYFNGPNSLTLFRLFLIGPAHSLIITQKYLWACSVLIVAYGLDFFDGYFARKTNQVTEFGAKFDPTADKALNLIFLNFTLAPSGIFNYTVLTLNTIHVITAIEAILFLIAWIIKPVLISYGYTKKIGANWLGKTKMFFESAAVITAVLILSNWLEVFNYLIPLANIFIIIAIPFGVGSIYGHLYLKNIDKPLKK